MPGGTPQELSPCSEEAGTGVGTEHVSFLRAGTLSGFC